MISICIPVYNFNVTELVGDLHRQAAVADYPVEILLVDDASSIFQEENRQLADYPTVYYEELEANVGRSKIRNYLAEKAQYPYLIFMDCDTKIIDSQFLNNYFNILPADVVMGGCAYYLEPPKEKEFLLRWKYGITRESRKAVERNKKPNTSFSTFNFLIKKDLLSSIGFDECISGYGHEDTLLGWDLKQKGIPIIHIDNPLIHQVMDSTNDFISKTENSVKNLWLIYQQMNKKEEFASDIALLKCFVFLQKYHLTNLYSLFYKLFSSVIIKNLYSGKPQFFLFDLFKLGTLEKNIKQ